MSPLTALPSSLSAYGLTPRVAVEPPEVPPLQAPGVQGPAAPGRAGEVSPSQPSADFATLLTRFVSQVNGRQTVAAEAVNALHQGQNVPLHQAVIAMEEANVSFQLMVEVRNKLLESYQEIMRMQV